MRREPTAPDGESTHIRRRWFNKYNQLSLAIESMYVLAKLSSIEYCENPAFDWLVPECDAVSQAIDQGPLASTESTH